MIGKIVGKVGRERYYLDGVEVSKEAFDEAFPDQSLAGGSIGGHLPANWPLVSEALAVHPKQVEEAAESARRKGVPTDFTADGQPILRDRDHRKRYLRAYGYHDRNGGYGD